MDTVLYFQHAASYSAPEKLAGVRDVAVPAGVHVQVVDEIPDAARVAALAEFWRPVGIVVDGGSIENVRAEPFAGFPTVFLSDAPEPLPPGAAVVRNDSAATARLAARVLLEAGCRHFAFVPSRERRRWSDVRGRAFAAAVRLNGGECAVMERPDGGGGGGDGESAWQTALRRFLRTLPLPCGVFAANDAAAAGALAVARLDGLAVPEDLVVVGVDNCQSVCEAAVPTLGSIEPDFRRGGRAAAEMLLEAVRGGGAFAGPRERSFGPPRMVHRASTRRLAVRDREVSEALDLIRREACSGLRAADAARVFRCSRRMADARFGRAVGRSFLAEIHAVRLETAKRLLSTTPMQLKAVADFCGFRDPNSLRKFFRAETGVSMREWRKRARAAAGRSPDAAG